MTIYATAVPAYDLGVRVFHQNLATAPLSEPKATNWKSPLTRLALKKLLPNLSRLLTTFCSRLAVSILATNAGFHTKVTFMCTLRLVLCTLQAVALRGRTMSELLPKIARIARLLPREDGRSDQLTGA